VTMWPQITFLLLMAFGIGSSLAKGQQVGLALFANAITFGLLYAGGFFTVLGWAP
jgi:hypothetical protein